MSYNQYLHKPENALRRAEELNAISQPAAALALLHEILSSRKHKTWSTTYEKIIIFYLDLCLELNRAREAKDGLHQYRNLSQSQAPGSLEGVIRHLIEKAEKKCKDAKDAVERGEMPKPSVASEEEVKEETTTADDEDDIDLYDGNPQTILLSTVSADPEKAQRETLILFPALKFLWEVYRAVLDILKSNSKLERLYHGAAVSALRFCAEYKRRTEFRRLCDMMRMHLGNLTKYGGVNVARFEDGGKNNKVCLFVLVVFRVDFGAYLMCKSNLHFCILMNSSHSHDRFVVGKDGLPIPLNFIYKPVSHNSKHHRPYVYTPRDSAQ